MSSEEQIKKWQDTVAQFTKQRAEHGVGVREAGKKIGIKPNVYYNAAAQLKKRGNPQTTIIEHDAGQAVKPRKTRALISQPSQLALLMGSPSQVAEFFREVRQ